MVSGPRPAEALWLSGSQFYLLWCTFSLCCFEGEGSSGVEGASGSTPSNQDGDNNSRGAAGVGASNNSSDRDANPLEPFLALDEGNRRLQGKGDATCQMLSP